ncbi:lipoyl synthase [Chloroflexota bacterium]
MSFRRHPSWLRQRVPDPFAFTRMKLLFDNLSLHTVCESAQCPNQAQCFSQQTATFLIMGDVCTRNCGFCAIRKGLPLPLDPCEPRNVALAASKLRLKHAVVTSVTRDDLTDGGASHFARTIAAVQQSCHITIEVLVPDFQGSVEALQTIVDCFPEVINHNIETVPRLYHGVRPKADYWRSLQLLRTVKSLNHGIVTKSGLMLGLGERHHEVLAVMKDLRAAGCDCLTMGQYLPPSPGHYPLVRYIEPSEFKEYEDLATGIGFISVCSGPLVRSSFNALEMYQKVQRRFAEHYFGSNDTDVAHVLGHLPLHRSRLDIRQRFCYL